LTPYYVDHRTNTVDTDRLSKAMKDKELELLKQADVILGTIDSSSGPLVTAMPFTRVIVDEAGQVSERSIIQTYRPSLRQLVLIGDGRQLPPFQDIDDSVMKRDNFSLFGLILAQRAGRGHVQLNVQYRCHPAIASIAAIFYDYHIEYGGQLSSRYLGDLQIPGFDERNHLFYSTTVMDSRVVFIDCGCYASEWGIAVQDDAYRSNHWEVSMVVEMISRMLKSGPDLARRTIRILSPYQTQVALLKFQFMRRYRDSNGMWVEGLREEYAKLNLSIHTIDGSQGIEGDVVILSLVRQNPRQSNPLGFMHQNYPRALVALSRAKDYLFILGSEETYSIDPMWKKVFGVMRYGPYHTRMLLTKLPRYVKDWKIETSQSMKKYLQRR
jgi:superfamily I DNA and/or RNA helicase